MIVSKLQGVSSVMYTRRYSESLLQLVETFLKPNDEGYS